VETRERNETAAPNLSPCIYMNLIRCDGPRFLC
jgi:hypothetical protein